MTISSAESHHVSVLAGKADVIQLCKAVEDLALRECIPAGDVLIACKDDYHQTSAHIAAKVGQLSRFHRSSFVLFGI